MPKFPALEKIVGIVGKQDAKQDAKRADTSASVLARASAILAEYDNRVGNVALNSEYWYLMNYYRQLLRAGR